MKTRSLKPTFSLALLPWLLGAAAAAYLAYRYVRTAEAFLDERIADKLPISKDLQTITDFDGNYDIDGVSYDVEGVIISSDNSKTIIAPI